MSTPISLDQAKKMTTLYRNQKDKILNPSFLGKDILPISESFTWDDINSVLSQPDCIGLRIYYGMDDKLQIHLIIVGTNEKDEDILPAITTEKDSLSLKDGGIIIEEGTRCPPRCGPSSPLNP